MVPGKGVEINERTLFVPFYKKTAHSGIVLLLILDF